MYTSYNDETTLPHIQPTLYVIIHPQYIQYIRTCITTADDTYCNYALQLRNDTTLRH